MPEGAVFDADLHNKRLQVHGLFGPKTRMSEPVKPVHAPALSAWTLQLPLTSSSAQESPPPRTSTPRPGGLTTKLCTRPTVLRGALYAAHAGVFLALLASSTPSFAVLAHAAALVLAPALLLTLEADSARAAALLTHLAGVGALLHRTPALDATVLSPLFYALFTLLLLARIAQKALGPAACVSRMCGVFYTLHAAAVLAIAALFAVREAVAHDPRDRAALDLTATATVGIVLACHVLF